MLLQQYFYRDNLPTKEFSKPVEMMKAVCYNTDVLSIGADHHHLTDGGLCVCLLQNMRTT